MGNFLVVLTFFVYASIAFSAEPLEGSWVLDPTETTFTEGTRPQPQILTIERRGSEFIYTGATGSQILIRYTVPVAGGTGKFITGPYDGVFHKRIDAYRREATYYKGGKAMMSFQGEVDKDGRHLRIKVKGLDARGRPISRLSVYTKRE
jgi:hypothetical protein